MTRHMNVSQHIKEISRRKGIVCQTRLRSKKKKSSSIRYFWMKDSLCNRLFISSSIDLDFREKKKKKSKKKRIDVRSREVRRTLILQEESSCRVQPLRGDKVEGDHARVRNDLDASRGTAILEQRSSFFSHPHDVHAIAICFWSLENN